MDHDLMTTGVYARLTLGCVPTVSKSVEQSWNLNHFTYTVPTHPKILKFAEQMYCLFWLGIDPFYEPKF